MGKPVGPYSPAMRAGALLFVSGQVGIVEVDTVDGPVAGSLAEGGVEAPAAPARHPPPAHPAAPAATPGGD